MMDLRIANFVANIYNLKTLIRYNTTPHIRPETVAEQLAFTTLIVLRLHENYDFKLEDALVMAITHDIPEIEISDIPHPVKDLIPEVNKAIREMEIKIWDKYPKHWGELNEVYENGATVEAKIVKLADAMSVYQYCVSEVTLGNKGLQHIIIDSTKRCEVLQELLVPHLRKK